MSDLMLKVERDNLRHDNRRLKARIKWLEKAGDELADGWTCQTNMGKLEEAWRREHLEAWTKAKEAKL